MVTRQQRDASGCHRTSIQDLTPLGRIGGWLGLALIALVTIGCDRVTKHAAVTFLAGTPGRSFLSDTVWLGYVENEGGFLSLGAGLPPGLRTAVFTVATGVMLCVMASVAFRRHREGLPAAGLTLFIAGGASNWIDRLLQGSVVDFVNIGWGPIRTGVFNVADVAIMIGAGLFVLAELDEWSRRRSGGDPAGPDPKGSDGGPGC